MISGRTRDAVSQAAFDRLRAEYRWVGALARAPASRVERTIHDVTFAPDKARHVVSALRRIRRDYGVFHIDFLHEKPLAEALALLERLPGVGRKVSAATLNASTLAMPVLIVDTHVLRVLRRLGAVGAHADYRSASETMTETLAGWSGSSFLLFHVALKRLGQIACRHARPRCDACLLSAACPSARGTVSWAIGSPRRNA